MNIIAFAGVAGAGKSTAKEAVVAHLLRHHSGKYAYKIRTESFAAPIRNSLATLGVTKERDYQLYRNLATQIGATCRQHNPNFFVDQMHDRLSTLKRHGVEVVVIDDMRYANEIESLTKDWDADTVFIRIPDSRLEVLGEAAAAQGLDHYNHESEALALHYQRFEPDGTPSEVKFGINNEDSLDAFKLNVGRLVEEIIGSHG